MGFSAAPEQAAAESRITDDAMVLERYGDGSVRVKLIPGDYRNIKITTREDLPLAEEFLGSLRAEEGR